MADETTTETITTSPIFALWNRGDKAKRSEDQDLAYEDLMADGDATVIKLKRAVNDANRTYVAALTASEKKANFADIAKAGLALKLSRKQFTEATEEYKALFGKAPKITL